MIDFDEYLKSNLEDPKFREYFNAAFKRLKYINDNVKGNKKQELIQNIASFNNNIDLNYLNKLPIKKLFKLNKYYERKNNAHNRNA